MCWLSVDLVGSEHDPFWLVMLNVGLSLSGLFGHLFFRPGGDFIKVPVGN